MKFEPGLVISIKEFGGNRITFRFPKAGDAPSAMRYINGLVDEEARVLLREKITLVEEKKWLKRTISSILEGKAITLVAVCDGEICGIAGVDRRGVDTADSHVASYHVGVSRGFRRLGVASYASRLVFDLAKKAWKTKVVKSSYVADNIKSARLHRKLGFKVVGRIPKATKYGNRFIDEVICYKEM